MCKSCICIKHHSKLYVSAHFDCLRLRLMLKFRKAKFQRDCNHLFGPYLTVTVSCCTDGFVQYFTGAMIQCQSISVFFIIAIPMIESDQKRAVYYRKLKVLHYEGKFEGGIDQFTALDLPQGCGSSHDGACEMLMQRFG